MPTAFERFRFSFFEDTDSARQGLDLAALGELNGEERARAEELLMAYLPDSRGVIGLGVLRSARARPALSMLFEAEQRAQLADGSDWYPYGLIDLARILLHALAQIVVRVPAVVRDLNEAHAALGETPSQ